MESSPLFTAPNDMLAADLAFRLNREEALKNQPSRIALSPEEVEFIRVRDIFIENTTTGNYYHEKCT
jgi:hypothetical protein